MKNRRSTLTVKDEFQGQMIFTVVAITFCFLNLELIWVFVALDTLQDLSNLKTTLAFVLGAGEIGGLILIYRYSLLVSHRIAGPIHNLEARLRELGEGHLGVTMKLRAQDHFQETGAAFNECVGQLRQRVTRIHDHAEALQAQLRQEPRDTDRIAASASALIDATHQFDLHRVMDREPPPGDPLQDRPSVEAAPPSTP